MAKAGGGGGRRNMILRAARASGARVSSRRVTYRGQTG